MKLFYLLKKYQTSITSRLRPTLPQGINNHEHSWLILAIAYSIAKTYKNQELPSTFP